MIHPLLVILAICATVFGVGGAILANSTTTIRVRLISADPIPEGSGSATFQVRLSDRLANGQVSVKVSTVNLTGDNAAIGGVDPDTPPGADYIATSRVLTFTAGGPVSQTVTVPIIDDTADELNELFQVELTELNAGGTTTSVLLGAPATVEIEDDDSPDLVSIDGPAAPVAENAGSASFTVRINQPSVQPVTVSWVAVPAGANGVALPPDPAADIAEASGNWVIPAGQTTGTFTIGIVDDTVTEADEQFTVDVVGVSNIANADFALAQDRLVTIADNDGPPAVAVNAGLTVPEGGTGTISQNRLESTSRQFGAAGLTYTLNSAPANGTLFKGAAPLAAGDSFTQADVNNDLITYTHDGGETTGDGFSFTVSDGARATGPASFSITVTPVDDPPTAVNDTATVSEDSGAAPINVLANDTDPDGGTKLVASVTQPANGTVAIAGGGTGLTYQPNANYCNSAGAPDTFTYTITGGSTATVSVTVTCVDDPPAAVNDTATVTEDAAATVLDVLANDTDIDAGPKLVTSVSQPANGTVAITGAGTGLTYRPSPNYCNTQTGGTADTFTYTLAPGGSTATVSVTVTCVDDPPAAVNDTATVTEDSGATAIDVLANDTDIDGGIKLVASVTQPANGTVAITGAGTGLTYQPSPNYCNSQTGGAADTFTYTLNGGSTATVSVTVTCVDDPPAAVNDTATVAEDAAATAINVLANDLDPDGGPKTIASVTQPANGTVAITGAGTGLTYRPNANYCNSSGTADTFTYTLTGGSTATVSVTVTCVDDPPAAVNDTATVQEDAAATAVDVLANDRDAEGDPFSIASVTQPANGTVAITGAGTGLTYQPNADYCNSQTGSAAETFTYTLAPGGTTATVSVTVTCVDDPPAAVDDTATVQEDAAASAVDVLANETDIDAGPRTVASVTQPANGTVAITGAGTGLTYRPNANYCNSQTGGAADTFTYTLAPGGTTATVSVTVTCVNDAPVVDANGVAAGIDGTASYTEGAGPASLVAADLTIGDVDSAALSQVVVQITDTPVRPADVLAVDTSVAPGIAAAYDAASATLTLSGSAPLASYEAVLRTLTFDNTSNRPGAARALTIIATDDEAQPASGSPATGVALSIAENDEPPTLPANTGLTVVEGAAANITPAQLAAADNDNPAAELVFTLTAAPAHGTLSLGGAALTAGGSFTQADVDAGRLSYAHDGGETSSDSFGFTLTDGTTTLPAATFAITVAPANDAPVIGLTRGATAYTRGDPAVVVDAGATVSDVDSADFAGGTLTVALTGAGAGDSLSVGNQGTGAGQIGVSGNALTFGGLPIGSFAGGAGATPLTVTFSGAAATPAAAQAVARNVVFASTSATGGARTATFTLSDGDGQTGVAASKVIAYNRPPVAAADSASVVGGSPATAVVVLANDSDPDGDPLTIVAVTQGAHGQVAIVSNGAGLTYRPAAGYTGADSFTYTVRDGRGGSATATVSITVTEPPAQVSQIFLPLLAAAAPPRLPDLQVSMNVSPAAPQAGAPANIQVTVTNRGSAPASNFWVDFYINPRVRPAVNQPWNELCSLEPCFGMAWLYTGTLQPGQSVTLNSSQQSASNPNGFQPGYSTWRGYFANGTTALYAVVDSWNRDGAGGVRQATGAVLESDETNNLAEQRITVGPGTLPAGRAASPAAIPDRPALP